MKNLIEAMKKYAEENEMNYEELCETACFDFHPLFSERIVEFAWVRLGIDENDLNYDYCCDEYQNTVECIYNELING